MSYQVNWEIQALDQTAGFLRDDPIGVAALWETVRQPPMSRGRRSRSRTVAGSAAPAAGRYRVFYTIDEERRVVQIDHVARLP